MKWLRPLFIINVILASLVGISLPVMLLVSVGSSARLTLVGVLLCYVIASIWLVIWGKKNRLTAWVAIVMVTAILGAITWVSISDQKHMADECTYFQTHCAKLDGQPGLFHCGATVDSKIAGGITVTHVEEECMPTQEQSCAYAKQFCTLISPKDSATTHYKCDHETITCP